MSKLRYCAKGEEYIEFVADEEAKVQTWIDETVADNEMPADYYQIVSMTQAELDALPED